MKIIDLTAGKRAIWYKKNSQDVLFCDIRPEMEPDIVIDCQTEDLIKLGKFDVIVFDPPHMNCGPNSNMSKRYGHWTNKQIREMVKNTSIQAAKIAKKNTVLLLKWNNHDIKLKTIFDLMQPWEPLCGHLTKNGPHSQTFFVMMKIK